MMSKNRSPVRVDPEDTSVLVGWLHDFIRQGRLAWRLFWDDRVPLWTKLIPPAALAYVLFPVDIIPDLLPAAGQLDDIAVLLLGIKLFIEVAPPEVAREHLRALSARVREWHVVEDVEPAVVENHLPVEGPGTGGEIELHPDSDDSPLE
jgi:uncharacterized membrane protein YkvA (DUF1232 family)